MGFSNGDMKSKVHKYNHTQHQLIMFHLSTKKVLKILYGPNLFSFYCKVILLLNVSRLHINSKYVRVFFVLNVSFLSCRFSFPLL